MSAPEKIDFNNKSILVTGGTGSFGRNFVRAVLKHYAPSRLVIYSRDEMKQYELQLELPIKDHPSLRYFIGDVRDRDRLVLASKGIDYIVHAAALKHVPAMEYNPFECVQTNIYGAQNVVRAAIECGVKKVIALSTDKACSPINLYGATKLASDKIFVAANNLSGQEGTRFSVARYGNVIGSRGSVVPFFHKLIAEGCDSLPITDSRMTRFWITIGQGVDFVLTSFVMMQGGEIFVPKIPSMRVADLAKVMAPHLPHRIIGIRPGEKLHETMITKDDARNTVELPDRYIIEPSLVFWSTVSHRQPNAVPVAEEFTYRSDGNTDWLDGDRLRARLKAAEGESA